MSYSCSNLADDVLAYLERFDLLARGFDPDEPEQQAQAIIDSIDELRVQRDNLEEQHDEAMETLRLCVINAECAAQYAGTKGTKEQRGSPDTLTLKNAPNWPGVAKARGLIAKVAAVNAARMGYVKLEQMGAALFIKDGVLYYGPLNSDGTCSCDPMESTPLVTANAYVEPELGPLAEDLVLPFQPT